ncbi:MAG: bile acid:sodium symporter [Thermoplasmata archaeon]|nr:bile acid:sodium symporter [Thermoplasmata archaeon]
MKFLSSFTFVVGIAVVSGFIVGKVPYGNEIATVALIIAMTLSISNISFKLSDFDKKKVGIALAINYIFLTGVILAFSIPFRHTIFFSGMVAMAAAPPAVAVLPLTRIAGGNERLSLFALVLSYIAAIFIMPFLIYIFLAKLVSIFDLLKSVALLILLPMLLSRFVKKDVSNEVINAFFFFVIFPIIGANRNLFLTDAKILAILSILMALRTIGSGALVKKVMKKFGERDAISYSMFAAFKNEGLVMILSASLFGGEAAIPAILATLFELGWVAIVEAGVL